MNEVLTQATTQKNIENVTLLTRSRSQKEHIQKHSIYIKLPEQANPQRQKSRLVDSKAGGGEVRNDRFPFWSKENALILGVVIDVYHCEYIKKILKGRNLWPVTYI